jgi:hypothetical protein
MNILKKRVYTAIQVFTENHRKTVFAILAAFTITVFLMPFYAFHLPLDDDRLQRFYSHVSNNDQLPEILKERFDHHLADGKLSKADIFAFESYINSFCNKTRLNKPVIYIYVLSFIDVYSFGLITNAYIKTFNHDTDDHSFIVRANCFSPD